MKGEKRNPNIEKPQDVGHFLVQNFDFCARPSHNVVKRDASRQERQAVVLQPFFDWIKANLAEIQPTNHQNVKKCTFCKKLQESVG